ncbi:MAG: CcdC protein domain-containing protein [Sphingomicrobium sp.]
MTVEQPHGWLATLLPFVIIGVIVLLRLRSMRGERKLNLKSLWVVPVIYLALIAFMFTALPPSILGWELILAGLMLGLLVGWYRGRMIAIRRDPETGELRQKASPLAMLLLVAIIVLKLGARQVFGEAAASSATSPAMLMTDAFIGFALGLLSATRIEMYTRARRLLAGE